LNFATGNRASLGVKRLLLGTVLLLSLLNNVLSQIIDKIRLFLNGASLRSAANSGSHIFKVWVFRNVEHFRTAVYLVLQAWFEVSDAHLLQGCERGEFLHLEFVFHPFVSLQPLEATILVLDAMGRSSRSEHGNIHAVWHILLQNCQMNLTLDLL